jgi:hypothetical protein
LRRHWSWLVAEVVVQVEAVDRAEVVVRALESAAEWGVA